MIEEHSDNIMFQKLLSEVDDDDDKIITLEVTVPTGLEFIAINEIKDKGLALGYFGKLAGRVYFNTTKALFPQVLTLSSIDNINMFVHYIPQMEFGVNVEMDLTKIAFLNVDLLTAAKKWSAILNFNPNLTPNHEEYNIARMKQDKVLKCLTDGEHFNPTDYTYFHNVLKYRVTCERVGQHSFTSNDAAYKFGGEVNNKYKWIVSLSDWDLNILLRIKNDSVMVCYKVTRQSLHRRYLVDFGSATLRPTICFGMLSLAFLKEGHHLVDPLCGSGAIPIECMYTFPNVVVSCGDINQTAMNKTIHNIEAQDNSMRAPDLFTWNANYLPFQNHTIDAIVTDLPFGKRCGSKRNNSTLYKLLFKEFARVLRLNTGRLVVLTNDKPNLFKTLKFQTNVWNNSNNILVNVGALKCILFSAFRSSMLQSEIPQ